MLSSAYQLSAPGLRTTSHRAHRDNPFGILKLFASRRFRAHWFETAAPRFLVDTLLKHGFAAPDLESVRADEDLLSAFEAERA